MKKILYLYIILSAIIVNSNDAKQNNQNFLDKIKNFFNGNK